MTDQRTIRGYLALGDSYTAGEGVALTDRWTNLLMGRLEETAFPIDTLTTIAKTGWTTDELREAIVESQLGGVCNLITLLIGVNDQYRGRTAEEYRASLQRLANPLPRHVQRGGRFVILSIPDWGVTPFAEGRDRAAIAREIDAFNAVNREEARRLGADYVDITPISRRAARDASLIASDGLHPSRAMYEEWADLVARCVLTDRARPAPPPS